VILVLGERAVDEDLADPDLPELRYQDLQVVDESPPPRGVPVRVVGSGTDHENRSP
jgi:hypothetical protein